MQLDSLDSSVERLYILYQDAAKVFGYVLDPGDLPEGTRIFGVADINSWLLTFHDGETLQLDDFDELHSYLIDTMERYRDTSKKIDLSIGHGDQLVFHEEVDDWREQWAIVGEQVKELWLNKKQTR